MCVCPTLDKGFSTTTLSTLHEQGGREDLQGSAQRSSLQDPRMRKLITSVYLLVPSQAVTPLFHFLLHGSSRFPPHKHSSPAAVQPVRVSAACECQHCSTIQFKLTFPPCCSIAFLPNETIALTENPSSKCVLLSRPTRVLSVIPVTGAPILHGKATTPTHHRSLDSHRKAPTPSQNQLPHRPPGQKTVLEEYIGFQLSDFRFQISFHVFKSCVCFHVLLY